MHTPRVHIFFFFNDTATTEIYTLSLHDALPISARRRRPDRATARQPCWTRPAPIGRGSHISERRRGFPTTTRSEEHTSELQSQSNLVCRLLLEKKKKIQYMIISILIDSTAHHRT